MSSRPKLSASISAIALAGATVALSVLGVQIWNTDAALERGFERALANRSSAPPQQPAAGVVGSEEFWLSAHGATAQLTQEAKAKPVAIGDRMTLALGDFRLELSVDEIREVDGGLVNASSNGKTQRSVMLICRDVNRPLAEPIRLVIDASNALLPAGIVKSARAL